MVCRAFRNPDTALSQHCYDAVDRTFYDAINHDIHFEKWNPKAAASGSMSNRLFSAASYG